MDMGASLVNTFCKPASYFIFPNLCFNLQCNAFTEWDMKSSIVSPSSAIYNLEHELYCGIVCMDKAKECLSLKL